jgi:hypothetical protein
MVKLSWHILLLMFSTSAAHALRQDQLAALRNAVVELQAPSRLLVAKGEASEGEIKYTVTGFEGSWPHRLKVSSKHIIDLAYSMQRVHLALYHIALAFSWCW